VIAEVVLRLRTPKGERTTKEGMEIV